MTEDTSNKNTEKNSDEKSGAKQGEQELTPEGTPVVRTIGRDFRVEDNDVDGYIGVNAEYRTYANETERPYITDEDVEVLTRTGQLTDVESMTLQVAGLKEKTGAVNLDDESDGEGDENKGDEDEESSRSEKVSKSPASQAKSEGQGSPQPVAPSVSSAKETTSTTRKAAGTEKTEK